jgi:hypothetical protein
MISIETIHDSDTKLEEIRATIIAESNILIERLMINQ